MQEHLLLKSNTRKFNYISIYMFIFINTIIKSIGITSDNLTYRTVFVLSLVFCMSKIFQDRFTLKELLVISLMLLIGIGNFFVTRAPGLILTISTLIILKNININRIFKDMMYIRLISFISLVFLSIIGIIPNKRMEMYRLGELNIRYSLGFPNPNSLHTAFFILTSLIIYNYFDSIKKRYYLLLMLFNYLIYLFSGSRTGFFATFVLIFLGILVSYKNKHINLLFLISTKYFFLFMISLSFIMGFFYDKSNVVMNILDRFLTGRLNYANYFLINFEFSLFGNQIGEDVTAFLDNGYIYMYVQYGIIGILFLSLLILLICSAIEEEKDVRKSILVLCFLLYFFTESFIANIYLNVILFFAVPVLFKNAKDKTLSENSEL